MDNWNPEQQPREGWQPVEAPLPSGTTPPPLPLQPPEDIPSPFAGPFAQGKRGRVTLGLILILGGMLSLFALAMVEEQWRKNLTWGFALAGPVVGEPPGDSIPTLIRPVPIENFPEQAQLSDAISKLLEAEAGEDAPELDFSNTEALMMAEVAEDDLHGMLSEGRLPEPGKPEVLAGDLCRVDSFKVDNIAFNVVGRVKVGVGALTYTYLLPKHSAWEPLFDHGDTLRAWIVPDGKLDAREVFIEAGLMKEEDRENMAAVMDVQEVLSVYEGSHLHSMSRTLPVLSLAASFVLLVMLIGTTLATTHLFLLCRPRAPKVIQTLCETVALNQRSWYFSHACCYGLFFLIMLVGLSSPRGNMQVIEVVKQLFSEGELAYIGEAYLSGDVFAAANATWVNNFFVQTVQWGALPNVVLPGWGFFKTLANLGVAAFALAPNWTDAISGYVLHSGTMVLELEPYVIVAWACLLWPLWIIKGIRQRNLAAYVGRWLVLMVQCLIVAAVSLYVAALYEGVTLIAQAQL